MRINPVNLIKFDIKTGTNEYCYYKLLDDEGIIIEKSGSVGFDYLYRAYDGGSYKLSQLVKAKKVNGYKDLEIEELKEDFTQLIHCYSTNQYSGLLLFDDENVEKFVQTIINNTGHNIKLSYFVDYYPISNNTQTPLGLIPKSVILNALSILAKIDDLLRHYLSFNQTNLVLKKLLMDKKTKIDNNGAYETRNRKCIDNINAIAKQLRDLLNNYFCLIPTQLQVDELLNMLLESGALKLEQQNICNLMLSYYKEIESLKSVRMLNISDYDIKLEKVIDNEDFKRISSLYNSNNYSYPCTYVKNVFKIQFGEHIKRFNKKLNIVGNAQCVWHGTVKKNIASIITRGLLMPENLSGSRNGGVYGSGIYFSSASRKSLSFCNDWINTLSMSNTTTFLILASVAAGKYFVPTNQCNSPPRGYHSIWAHKYSGTYNDELVVYSEDQVRIDYIVEIESK